MIDLPNELEDDSPDLTDEQVAHSVAVPTVDAMIEHLKGLRCPQDNLPLSPKKHALRRRAPFFYAVVVLECGNDIEPHEVEVVFRADWLQPGSS